MSYLRRVIDEELDELVPALPAMALEGAKGVGKTETALQRAATVFRLAEREERARVEGDPGQLLRAPPPILIDEYQRLPGTWDSVRNAVDGGAPAGSFLLTGSASTDEPRHSGAGRIPIIRMRPLSLAERAIEAPTVSLRSLLADDTRPDLNGSTDIRLGDYAQMIVQTGLPGFQGFTGRALRNQLDGYLARVVDRDFVDEVGITLRRPDGLRALMTAYAAATSTVMTWSKIREAAAQDDEISAPTGRIYREALTRLWLLDPLPSWLPTMSPIRRTTGAPRHHLADPGLAARLLGADVDALLTNRDRGPRMPRDGLLLGSLFESLVTLSVRVYAQQAEARASHFRTQAGQHEVDLIVERADRCFVAIEVKLAAVPAEKDFRHLKWLQEAAGGRMIDAIIITTGRAAYRRRDGIGVVPAVLLGP
jgi:uncharacterized protein